MAVVGLVGVVSDGVFVRCLSLAYMDRTLTGTSHTLKLSCLNELTNIQILRLHTPFGSPGHRRRSRASFTHAGPSGVTLLLLPMLTGFFTYKLAIAARQAKDVLQDMSVKPRGEK